MPLEAGPLYRINLATDGTFKRSGNIQTHPEDVDAIFDRLRQQQIGHLVLYFHGGLVSEAQGLERANQLMPLFMDRIKAHPIFFIWESGLIEVIENNLTTISGQGLFNEVLNAVMKFALSKMKSPEESGRDIGTLRPATDAEVQAEKAEETTTRSELTDEERENLTPVDFQEEQQFTKYLKNRPTFQNEADKAINAAIASTPAAAASDSRSVLKPSVEAVAEAPTAEEIMLSQEVLDELRVQAGATPDEQGRGLISTAVLIKAAVGALRNVVTRMIAHTDHGVYCTTVEEVLRQLYFDKVGRPIWNGMKDATRSSFDSKDGLTGDKLHGGCYFLEKLCGYLTEDGTAPLKISLVGHSAGAIYVCRLLEKAYEMLPASFKFHKIVFLAPAVDFDLFKSTIIGHQERFDDLRIYAMQDQYEAMDHLVPVIYPRSLLYFVSGMLEGASDKPLMGMERYFSRQQPYNSDALLVCTNFVKKQGKDRVVWSIASNMAPGLNSGAQHHGGFALDPTTQDSVAYFLGN
jgi:hypothetical protein